MPEMPEPADTDIAPWQLPEDEKDEEPEEPEIRGIRDSPRLTEK